MYKNSLTLENKLKIFRFVFNNTLSDLKLKREVEFYSSTYKNVIDKYILVRRIKTNRVFEFIIGVEINKNEDIVFDEIKEKQYKQVIEFDYAIFNNEPIKTVTYINENYIDYLLKFIDYIELGNELPTKNNNKKEKKIKI